MKVAMVGTGYVGLVSGTCFAETGNTVFCVDIDEAKVASLKAGNNPIYEPGLDDLLKRNIKQNRLRFTTSLAEVIDEAQFIFIAVGTPTASDGSADLQYVRAVAEEIGQNMKDYKVIVNKSTVPVGTGSMVDTIIQEQLTQREENIAFSVVSNPEFLKEGAAVEDFMRPDRIIIGSNDEKATGLMLELYAPFVRNEHPILTMDRTSAELTKYAANGFLATKISFMNEIANLAEKVGADITSVRKGIGSDRRIGLDFLYPGPGYGGSCFPKDVKALVQTGSQNDETMQILNAVEEVNARQKTVLGQKLARHFDGNLKDKTIALWGMAFKAKTDDMRESPAIDLVEFLLKQGARVVVYDPEALENSRRIFGDKISYAEDNMAALEGADALVIVTEWSSFRNPDFNEVKTRLKQPVIIDGRNLYKPETMAEKGFYYISIGRSQVKPA